MSYHDFVSKFYKMDPSTDDIAKSGYQLCDGMIVLIENTTMRENTEQDRLELGYGEKDRVDKYAEERMLKNNRWCLVTQFDTHREHEQISFIAVYADGSKAAMRYGASHEWLFKLDCTRTDALVVSEQEWEEINYRPEQTYGDASTPQEKSEERFPLEMVEKNPIFRVCATYAMMGDLEGPEWFDEVFGYHKRQGNILDGTHLVTLNSTWVRNVTFTVDVMLENMTNDLTELDTKLHEAVAGLIHDSPGETTMHSYEFLRYVDA